MGKEIERKFLVKGRYKHLAEKESLIMQGYLSVDDNKVVRLRIAGNEALLTIKARAVTGTIERNEWNIPVSVQDAREMMKLCYPCKIEKIRRIIPAGKHVFEVDEFIYPNEGLVIAEIELDSENEQFKKPDWLGEEVTGKPEYYNSNMLE